MYPNYHPQSSNHNNPHNQLGVHQETFSPNFLEKLNTVNRKIKQAEAEKTQLQNEIKMFSLKGPQLDEIEHMIKLLIDHFVKCTDQLPYMKTNRPKQPTVKEVIQLMKHLEAQDLQHESFTSMLQSTETTNLETEAKRLLHRLEHHDRTADNPESSVKLLFQTNSAKVSKNNSNLQNSNFLDRAEPDMLNNLFNDEDISPEMVSSVNSGFSEGQQPQPRVSMRNRHDTITNNDVNQMDDD